MSWPVGTREDKEGPSLRLRAGEIEGVSSVHASPPNQPHRAIIFLLSLLMFRINAEAFELTRRDEAKAHAYGSP